MIVTKKTVLRLIRFWKILEPWKPTSFTSFQITDTFQTGRSKLVNSFVSYVATDKHTGIDIKLITPFILRRLETPTTKYNRSLKIKCTH